MRELRRKRKFYNHIPAWRVRCRIPGKTWKEYFKFCVERNPWDKTLSHYHFKRRLFPGMSLGEYLERGFSRLNHPRYTDYPEYDQVLVDRIIRYETLDDELGEIFGLLGIPFEGRLGVFAKSSYRSDRRPYREVLSIQQRDMIQEVYKKEIGLLGYKW